MSLLSRIAAVVAVAYAVGGCASTKEASDIVEITYVHPVSTTNDPTIQRALDEFMREHPKIRVRRIGVAGDYYSKLMIMIAGNTAPDVMWMGQSFGEFAERGALLNISRVEPSLKTQDHFQSVVDWYRLKGDLYGFPYGVDCIMLAYNKDLFRKAGVPFPTDGWNLHQFIATGRRLMESQPIGREPEFYAYGGAIEGIERGVFGATILTKDNQRSALNSPAAIEAAQFNYDMGARYHIRANLAQNAQNAADSSQAFKLGKLAMTTVATYELPSFHRDIKGFDWDVVAPPSGRQRAVWGSSSGVVIFARTPHPRESIMLLKQLVSPAMQLEICRNTGCFPSHRATAARWLQQMPSTPKNLKTFVAAVPYLKPAPRVVALSEILDTVSRADERVMLGGATARQAMQDASQQVDAVIERQNRLLAHDRSAS